MLLQIFKSILLTSVIGSILATALLLLKPITKRVFGSTWQYYAWAMVLIVMICPVSIELPKPPTPVTPVSQSVRPTETEITVQQEKQLLQNESVQLSHDTPFHNTIDAAKNISLGLTDIFSYAWIIGCMIILALTIFRYLLFLRTIQKNSVIISLPELGTKRIITRRTEMIDAPLMVGLFRPTLLLPSYEMSAENLKFILLHELTHYRRHDLWYKWFAMIVSVVHWFNPLIYIVLKQIDEECEISCDLSVAEDLDKQEQREYMHTILALIAKTGTKQKPLTTAMASNQKHIKRRFIMIKTMRKTKKATTIISAIMACMILVATILTSGVLANEVLTDGNKIEVSYNSTVINLKNKPFEENGEVYLPIRETLNACGVDRIEWSGSTNTVTVWIQDIQTNIAIGGLSMFINGEEKTLTAPPIIKDGVTFVTIGAFLRIKDYGVIENVNELVYKKLIEGLSVTSYMNGKINSLISVPFTTTEANKYDPKAYYAENEEVLIGTLTQQHAFGYNTPDESGNVKLVKRIIIDDNGKVIAVVPIENQMHEIIDINRNFALAVNTGWERMFSTRISQLQEDGSYKCPIAIANPDTADYLNYDSIIAFIPVEYQIQGGDR